MGGRKSFPKKKIETRTRPGSDASCSSRPGFFLFFPKAFSPPPYCLQGLLNITSPYQNMFTMIPPSAPTNGTFFFHLEPKFFLGSPVSWFFFLSPLLSPLKNRPTLLGLNSTFLIHCKCESSKFLCKKN